jgi:hypothetical protein
LNDDLLAKSRSQIAKMASLETGGATSENDTSYVSNQSLSQIASELQHNIDLVNAAFADPALNSKDLEEVRQGLSDAGKAQEYIANLIEGFVQSRSLNRLRSFAPAGYNAFTQGRSRARHATPPVHRTKHRAFRTACARVSAASDTGPTGPF